VCTIPGGTIQDQRLTLRVEDTMETLTRRYGEAFMSTTKCSFVITVPAVW
jgi:hypothetical protein